MKLTFPLALGLLFIGLKLGGVIAWSWLWVLSPFWLGLVFVACLYAVVLLFIGAAGVLGNIRLNTKPSFNGNFAALIVAGLALAVMVVFSVSALTA